MADSKAIANRIKSVQDTRKITNAMYLISSTKLQQAKNSMAQTRPYFHALRKEIGRIADNVPIEESRFFMNDESEAGAGITGILVLTADKGLAGAFNQNAVKEAMKLVEQYPNNHLFVYGEYGRHYFSSHNIPYDTSFDFADIKPTLYMARKMAGYMMDMYDAGSLSQIIIVYTHFKNSLTSETKTMRLLPFDHSHFKDSELSQDEFKEFEYFPSPFEVMEKCIPVYCIGIIYSVLVYSFCCEQNDRMMAMDSANQNADKLLKELNVQYNHLRQGNITQEITEISASVRASRRGDN